MPVKHGVYQILNPINGKRYIGSAAGKGFNNRWGLHKSMLKKGIHHSRFMQRSYDKYGDIFEYSVLATCPPAYALKMEQWFIDNLTPEFNISKRAGSTLGVSRNHITREKLSKALKGRTAWNKGKSFSPESRIKMSIANKGRPASQSIIDAASKIVLDTQTGVFYSSCKEAAPYYGISKEFLCQKLNGRHKNNTPLIYA